MAITIDCPESDTISVEECFDYAVSNVDVRCIDSMKAAAPYLARLANDKRFVADHLLGELKQLGATSANSLYSPHSFPLSQVHESFLIRANIWTPISDQPGRRELEERVLAYRRPHDHNFSFLTVGYFGVGYETDIYEYDYDTTAGYIGENVPLKFLERTRLEEGKVMLYRSGRDAHTQYPPEGISVSLNLIVTAPEERFRDQYYFDTDHGRISEYSDTVCSKRVSLLSMAAYLNTENTIDVLDHLARTHPCRRTRLQALNSLAIADRSDLDRWIGIAAADPDRMVRSFIDQPVRVSNYGWPGRDATSRYS